jgi:hypothetical protein
VHEGVLGGVLGVRLVAEHPKGDPLDGQSVPADELFEGVEPSRLGAADELGIVG